MPSERIYAKVKRLLDVVVAAGLLVVLSPVIGAVALAVRVQMGSPVLFRQKRPGHHGQPFELLKFRSMIDAFDAEGRLRSDAERLTALGRWLRATSLDELPQLWNVLRGDMSLVGPRPLLMDYLPLYDAAQARRHDVRPGVTGLAQVRGRNLLDWRQKFELDIWYVDHCSFLLDLRILCLTVIKVLRRDGIEGGAGTAMPRFEGGGTARKDEGR